MDAEKEKEEIIELTEVLEEGPVLARGKETPEPLPGPSEKHPPPNRPKAAEDSISSLPDSIGRMRKDPPTRQPESQTGREETRVEERLAADLIPRIVTERLAPEIGKIRAETDALRARGEAFSRKLEEWVSTEGLKFLEGKTREAVPRIVAETLAPEIETLKKEIEKCRGQSEDLNRQAQTWFANEGKQILERVVREVFPSIAEKTLRQEIERLKGENSAPEDEKR